MDGEAELKEKIRSIVSAIKELSVMELVELVKELENVFGVSAQAPVAVGFAGVAPATTAVPQEEKKEEKKKVKVILKDVGPNKLQVIKEVRGVLPELGLKEAKEFVESAPKVIKENITPEEAQEIKERFERVGAKIEIS